MRRRKGWGMLILLAGAGVAMFLPAAFGQVSSVYGSLRVSVVDATGAPVAGAEVLARLPDRGWSRSAVSGSEPVYFPALPPGLYRVSVQAADFEKQEAGIEVLLGHEASLRVVLGLKARREELTVTAEAGGVDSLTIPVHTHAGPREIAELPINQRNFLDFALLDSGLQRDTLRVHAVANTSGFNVLGQRPRSNSLQMDGADLNDESTGGVRGSVPMEAVQEFQVLANGYQAEYGRAGGGLINVITKAGTNRFHGTLFGFLRHRRLDATNAFSAVKDPPYTRTQYGGSLGGPLRRNAAWFFLSFEQLRRQESGFSRVGLDPAVFALTAQQRLLAAQQPDHPAIRAAVRGAAIAQAGIDPLTAAPPPYRLTPLAGLGGVYPVSGRNGAYMARLDEDFASRHRLALRINYAHERLSALEAQNNDQIAGLLAPERTAALVTIDPAAVATLSSVLRQSLLNDFRFSAAQRKYDMTPNSFAAPVNIAGAAFLGRENILPHYRKEKHFHLDDVVTLLARGHIVKFGGDWMRGPAEIEYHRLLNGLFVFGSQPAPGAPAGSPPLTPVQAYGLGLAGNYTQIFGDPRLRAGKASFGMFAQDSWRVHPRLTVDLGLRYDVEKPADAYPDPRPLEAVFRDLSLRRTPPVDKDNLQPRIGFAWQPPGPGRLTIRGSYGLYYDRLLNLATYLGAVNDGLQATRVILTGAAAAAVFQSSAQRLAAFPADAPPTGLIAFSRGWQLGYTQQGNLVFSREIRSGLAAEAGYVWVRGLHLGRSRDMNPPDTARAAAFVAAGNPVAALLRQNYFRPVGQVSEAMAFEGSASSVFHGLRLGLRGKPASGLVLDASYTWSKAIDDGEEIFPHSRAQDMRNFRAERGLALYDQRHRLVVSSIFAVPDRAGVPRLLRRWNAASIIEIGSGRPVNVLLGSDNNLDQDPSADRPDFVPRDTPGSFLTPLGVFATPPLGQAGNLGRNAFTGPGFASISLRLQREIRLREAVSLQWMAEAFNVFNRVNIRAVNPNFQRAGEPLAAFDPRQIQLGLRVSF